MTMKRRSIDAEVLQFVAQAFRDQMKPARITIDDLACLYVDVDTDTLEQRLGRRVTSAEILQAKTCCRLVMDRVIVGALDELRESLMTALMKIADDAVAPERND
jgi:hypothetical protein